MGSKTAYVIATLCCAMTAGCTRPVGVAELPKADCTPVPDGMYAFSNGKFHAQAPAMYSPQQSEARDLAVDELEATFVTLGYPWLSLQAVEGAVFLTGTAPDLPAKERGFAAGAALLKTHPAVQAESRVMVDRIMVASRGAENTPLDEKQSRAETGAACRARLSAVLETKRIQFMKNGASLTNQGAETLNAVAEIARECEELNLLITVRSSQAGSGSSFAFPAVRAESVRRHLERLGVNSNRLSVVDEDELEEAIGLSAEDMPQERPVEIFLIED